MTGTGWAASRIVVALALLAGALVMPDRVGPDAWVARLPAELPLLALVLALARGRPFAAVRAATTALFVVVVVLKAADLGTSAAFGRPFDPIADLPLAAAGWNLLSGTLGIPAAAGALAVAILILVLAASLLCWALGGFRDLPPPARRRWQAAAGALAALALGATALASPTPATPAAGAAAYLGRYLSDLRRAAEDRARFTAVLADDPIAGLVSRPLFKALKGRDVAVVFIESYGRSAIEDARYRDATGQRLAGIEQRLAAAGFRSASGWLASPTVGGQSWLAHGALLAGLPTTDQGRYDAMLASNRPTLNRLFADNGWRTLAVVPAITMDWPESAYFGYREVYAARDLGYRGLPFDWVTMPDQYTLSAFERIRGPQPRAPVMAEIVLISSHAPWTPIADILPWEAVGDGSAFTAEARRGDPPDVVWRDSERVRRQYAASIDYTLETLGQFVERHGRGTVFVILGDHQPAAIVTGAGASRDVPIHLVTDDPALLDAIGDWGWTPGLRPAPDAPTWPMEAFRERFVRAFSGHMPR